MKLIDKDEVVAEISNCIDRCNIKKRSCPSNTQIEAICDNKIYAYKEILSFLDTLEVKDPYEECIQYDSIKAGIQANAEIYSFNIESKLFNQLTKEQQELWRNEIEQSYISGCETGVEFARDTRYKENLEAKEVETWHLQEKENIYDAVKGWSIQTFACVMKDGTIQKFTGNLDEDCEGHINVHIDGVNDDYDDVDDIVKWIEYT